VVASRLAPRVSDLHLPSVCRLQLSFGVGKATSRMPGNNSGESLKQKGLNLEKAGDYNPNIG
jgi:hypothetical protein